MGLHCRSLTTLNRESTALRGDSSEELPGAMLKARVVPLTTCPRIEPMLNLRLS